LFVEGSLEDECASSEDVVDMCAIIEECEMSGVSVEE